MKFLLCSLLAVVVSLCSAEISQPVTKSTVEQTWRRQSSAAAEIYYQHTDQVFIREIDEQLQAAIRDLSERLKLRSPEPVTVFICATQAIFDSLTNNAIPHWGEGVAQPGRNQIIIKSPGLTGNRDRLSKLLRHEIAHIFCGQLSESFYEAPKWLIEGLAIYLSSDESFAGKALSKAFLSNSVIPLDEIDDLMLFPGAKARIAYEESYAFVSYLVTRFGPDKVVDLIRTLDPEKKFPVLFEQNLGIDIFDAEMDWYEQAKKEYRWHFLQDFDTYLWLLILSLFILVFLAVQLRNRKTLRRWEEEERIAGS